MALVKRCWKWGLAPITGRRCSKWHPNSSRSLSKIYRSKRLVDNVTSQTSHLTFFIIEGKGKVLFIKKRKLFRLKWKLRRSRDNPRLDANGLIVARAKRQICVMVTVKVQATICNDNVTVCVWRWEATPSNRRIN